MKICACCFNDEEIKSFIDSSSKEDANCDCCGQYSAVMELNDLSDFLVELLKLFEKNNGDLSLVNLIQKDWDIFCSTECATTILSEIMKNETLPFTIQDSVSYLSDIQECFRDWKSLKKEVRENKRYFIDFETYNWDAYIKSNDIIKDGSTLYRSRITPEDKTILDKNEMGAPPREKASAGRANPLGIPYLYLSDKIETTYYEIRAAYLDKISVGEFKTLRDLNIVDFNSDFDLFSSWQSRISLIDIVKNKFLFNEISTDLSKPLRRFDTEIEYVPTQLVCEYCKLINADGIRFNSSLHKEGKNIVLFNETDAECTDVFAKEIKRVIIES